MGVLFFKGILFEPLQKQYGALNGARQPKSITLFYIGF